VKPKKFIKIIFLIIIVIIPLISTACSFLYSLLADSPYDHFADGLEIPDNIEINMPRGDRHHDIYYKPETDEIRDSIDFELYCGFQGGLYWYYAWINNLEAGKIYLKAYEYTGNTELSSRRLLQATEIEIDNTGENITTIGPIRFTIYEGDWGKYYAARFELWYKPSDNTKYEMRLSEKNYLIEGWMR